MNLKPFCDNDMRLTTHPRERGRKDELFVSKLSWRPVSHIVRKKGNETSALKPHAPRMVRLKGIES